MTDKLPPQNLEAERSALSACLLSSEAVDLCAEVLQPDDFYRETHQRLFEVILHLRDSARPVDAVEVADEMIRRGLYADFGGNESLAEIANAAPHAANAAFHAKIIRQKAIARRLIQDATETIRDGYSNQFTATELLERSEQRIFAIAEQDATGSTVSNAVVIGQTMTELADVTPNERQGLMTGFVDLDDMLDGLKPEDFAIVAARPSQGKTSFALMVACNAALREIPVLFCSLEMGKDELGKRMVSCYANVDSIRLRRRMLTEEQRLRANTVADALSQAPLYTDDSARRTVTQIAANARRQKARSGLGLIVIDYMSLIDGQRQRNENRQEEVARIARRLKAMARELKVPVLCLCQLNRESERREGHRPRLGDLRESGQIEQDADVVMLIHRPEYYDPNDQPGLAEIIVAKNRNGPTGVARLMFQKHCTRFESMPDAVTTTGF